MNIAGRINKQFAVEAKAKQVVLEFVGVVCIDGRLAGVDNELDQVDKVAGVAGVDEIIGVTGVNWVAEVDDGLNSVNGIIGVAD